MNEPDIHQQFDHLFKVISSPEFLSKRSLGGEIPFFISAFEVRNIFEVEKAIRGLINKLETSGVSVLEINLYDLTMQILDRELGEGAIFELEKEMDKEEFKQALNSVLDLRDVLMPAIARMIGSSQAKVYFLTGIGHVFPYIRSHNILNNLQNVAKDAPTVAFFPGNYNGISLELFGVMKDDNYYRAFNIGHYKP
jgi:hypothetical protein